MSRDTSEKSRRSWRKNGRSAFGMVNTGLAMRQAVGEIAHSFRVREISVFGPALRDDLRPDSDIDLLGTFEQFDQDKTGRLATERQLPVLGEDLSMVLRLKV